MSTRYLGIFKGTSDAHYPPDRTNALSAGVGVDSNDSYKLKYNQNGTLANVPDSINGYQTAGPVIIAPSATAIAGIVAGGLNTSQKVIKLKTAITDAAATTVYTVTVPNAAHAATIVITVLASLGAGGAIGAFEASSGSQYVLNVARTAGVATVVATGAQLGVAQASVAGAATVTATVAASAITGAVTVTQTFGIQVTITKSGGASANHQCLLTAEVINANASGVTIA